MNRQLYLLLICLGLIASTDSAADECCTEACSAPMCHCCQTCVATCRVKVCRVSETTEKVSKTKYDCECEDFCIPGKSCFLGYTCECGPCGETKRVKHWKPGCGEVRTRLILKKSTEEEEVVAYKWEVIEVCRACRVRCRGCVCLSETLDNNGAMIAQAAVPNQAEVSGVSPSATAVVQPEPIPAAESVLDEAPTVNAPANGRTTNTTPVRSVSYLNRLLSAQPRQ